MVNHREGGQAGCSNKIQGGGAIQQVPCLAHPEPAILYIAGGNGLPYLAVG